MLDNSKASAYYGRKYAVMGISKGSTVYLYHTGVGIVAKGMAKSSYKKADHDGNRDEEYYVPLKFAWVLKEEKDWERAVRAWEINQALNSGYRFRQTAFAISEEIAKAIDALAQQHKAATAAAESAHKIA
jgi:hypothetical protein